MRKTYWLLLYLAIILAAGPAAIKFGNSLAESITKTSQERLKGL